MVAGALLAMLMWPLDAFMHAFVFGRGGFVDNLLLADLDELWMRSLISLLFFLFGWVVQHHVRALACLQARLERKRARLQQVIDTAYDAYIAIDAEGRVIGWNRSAEEMFGWRLGEAMGQDVAELIIPPDQRSRHRRGMEYYRAQGIGPALYRPLTVMAQNKQGERFSVEIVITPIKVEGKTEFFAFARKERA